MPPRPSDIATKPTDRAGPPGDGRPVARLPDRPRPDGNSQRVLEGQNRILKLIVHGRPSSEVLEALARAVEDLARPALCSVLLLEGSRLRHGSAPSLPAEYCSAIDGVEIGPNAGSCGTAAYRRAPVVVRDIATDLLWADYRDFALGFGLRACWSPPILTEEGNVLGTFALYYREPREPLPEDWDLLEGMAQLVRVLIERDKRERALLQTQQSLRANEQRLSERVAELEQTAVSTSIEPPPEVISPESVAQQQWSAMLASLDPKDLVERLEQAVRGGVKHQPAGDGKAEYRSYYDRVRRFRSRPHLTAWIEEDARLASLAGQWLATPWDDGLL